MKHGGGFDIGLPEGLDVFQVFVTTKPRGTGLGLSITRKILEQHGASISFTSEAGNGTTFTVHIPIVNGSSPVADGD